MQSLLAALFSWLLPSTGRRRRPAGHAANTPTRRLIITHKAVGAGRPAHRSPRAAAFVKADDLPLVRPYLIAHEREQERLWQQDRRTSPTLAALGIDFHGVPA
ncbi:hypothetical protein ACFYY3_07840 [Streptomyces sp. NPDC001812]|uniref:Uncharacterized protein n=1 Tax=Streptomyces cathayae TaxID=3031124 RepID=A0ABY8K704_9ACTN|nr:hypothetical protein [Streptomyces sp. HUAS 5]WGD42651.1 hypothetical protein PYS65_22290 [Streptomyces sp. HUAS 5]